MIKKDDNNDEKPTFYTIPPLTIKNEIKVLAEIEKICYNALKCYPSDYETDISLLNEINNQPERNENIRNILLMRIGEKKVLFINLDS